MGRASKEGGLAWKGSPPPASWQGQRYDAQDRAGQTDAVWAQDGGGLTPKFGGWTALKTWIRTGSLV